MTTFYTTILSLRTRETEPLEELSALLGLKWLRREDAVNCFVPVEFLRPKIYDAKPSVA